MRYHNITKEDMLNGDGIRCVLWLAGCEHHCTGCQNPITWDIDGGIPFDESAKKEIFQELDKDYVSGITFSGGDPLHHRNRNEVGEFIEEIKDKYPNKTIWVYTGYLFEEIQDLTWLNLVDVVVDGEFQQELLDVSLHWKGSSNQRVIDVKSTLQNKQIVIHE